MVLEYKMFEIEEVNGLFENKPYNIVYMNYEKEKGIEKVVNKESAWRELKNNNLNDFYKLYLFNDDRMITVYKFDKNNFQYTEMKKEYFLKKEETSEMDVIEREYYLSDDEVSKLKVRIGYIGKKENKIQTMQYVGFSGGGK